ncbi:hypothetical protein ACFV2Q_33250 [Streptomyces sp. NPDC059650]|uniref:hypothetical protein n=1 Tax=Streptomyces sp. NPDC059650 TaxID=3346896 RepID=UPI0036883ECE
MTQAWSIYVELGRRDAPDDLYDDLHDRLAAAHPAVGTAPNGNLSVRIFVEESTARQAIDTGLKAVSAALKDLDVTAPVVGVEAVTEAELDRRNAEKDIPALAGVGEIAELFGVTRGRAGQLTKRDDFPSAVTHLKSGPVYVMEQVQAFGQSWDRKGGRPPKAVLTEVEKVLLTALRDAKAASSLAIVGWTDQGTDIVVTSGEGRTFMVELKDSATAEAESPDEAIAKLSKEKLVKVTRRSDRNELEVELTPKGERHAAAM